MALGRKGQLTRLEILRTAVGMFLDIGYSNTAPKAVCAAMGISLGNLTYHFPSKEDILAELIEMLAAFQWKAVQDFVREGETHLAALGLELTAMAAMCEESPVAQDLYISAYTHDKSLTIIRKSDLLRAKTIFLPFCPNWTEEQFAEAELLVSGIEYATLRITPTAPPLETRIAGAMDAIFRLYNVPEERRQRKIQMALSMDYRSFGRRILAEFKSYVDQTTQHRLEEAEQIRSTKELNR